MTVLANASTRRGAISLVGVDDAYSGHADPRRSLGAEAGVPEVVLTHSPDLVHSLPTGRAPLLLAGHTHCGQGVLPWLGPVTDQGPRTGRRLYDSRYRCGVVVDPGRTVIVTAGLGASIALRFGAPPDIWLVRVGPAHPR